MATRWGIISAGGIANAFASALVSQDPDEHQIVAVAARSFERSQAFADKYGIKNAYGSYEELVKNPDVEIVYIGSIHPEHYKLSLLCLNAGKHVLCEKPVTMTLAAAKDIFALAKEKKLFFMEAFWSRFFPVYDQVRKELNEGNLGDVLMLDARFCMPIYQNARVHEKSLGGGGLLDIGCYPVMMADFVFNEKPENITAEAQLDENGVDVCGVILLRFSGGRLATLSYNTKTKMDNDTCTIMGTKGSIQINHPFWSPTSMTSPSGKFDFNLPECKVPDCTNRGGRGFQYEQQCVRECLQKDFQNSSIPGGKHGNTSGMHQKIRWYEQRGPRAKGNMIPLYLGHKRNITEARSSYFVSFTQAQDSPANVFRLNTTNATHDDYRGF